MQKCVSAAAKNWSWWNGNPKEEREAHRADLHGMFRFIREHVPVFGRRGWNLRLRAAAFLARFPDRLATGAAWQGNHLTRALRKHG